MEPLTLLRAAPVGGMHSCWAEDALGSPRSPGSFWHTEKSETETGVW